MNTKAFGWVPCEYAAQHLNCSQNTLYVHAHTYRKKHGVHPHWYRTKGTTRDREIEIDLSFFHRAQERRAKVLNRAHKIYYIAEEKGITEMEMGQFLADRGLGTPSSMYMWVRHELWKLNFNDKAVKMGLGKKFYAFCAYIPELIYKKEYGEHAS